MGFDEDWVSGAQHQEPSARERDLEARRKRWAELDRADLQGTGGGVQRARRARRTERWRKIWPWLAFFAVAAVLMTLTSLFG